MKRLFLLGAAALAFAFGFSACSQKELHEETISDIRFTLDSYLDEDAPGSLETKTGINGNAFIWSPNDTVGIFPNAGSQIYFSMEIGANASSASFDGGGWSLRNGYSYWSYYPFIGNIYLDRTKIPVAYDGQVQSGNDSSDHIGDYDFLYTDRCSPVNDALMFAFHHLDCILKPRVTLPAGTYTKVEITAPTSIFVSSGHYDLTSSAPSVDVSPGQTTILTDKLTLLLDDVTFTEPTELVGYLMAYPVDVSNVELTVTVYSDQDRKYAYKYTRTSSFAHGSIHNLRGVVSTGDDWNEDDEEQVNRDPYLTFRSEGTSTLALNVTGTVTGTFEYTLGDPKSAGTVWQTLSSTAVEFTSEKPIYVRGIRTSENTSSSYMRFSMSGDLVSVEGNILAIKDYTDMSCDTMDAYGCFLLFVGCSKLKDASKLVLSPQTVSTQSYGMMFSDCRGLTAAPKLPATTLATGCYIYMFQNCTGLTAAPELPATTLAINCYASMFNGCTGLTAAPELPATTLANSCYQYMFGGCTRLTAAPVLPATSLADQCYFRMFNGCTGLTAAPELPATTLAEGCYSWMFNGCTGLTAAPELPATTLATNCYKTMFVQCTGLKTAPSLPATILADNCYYRMFYGCTGLTSAPVLPATTLAKNCYYNMFYGCERLTATPKLPATSLAESCYFGMFEKCTGLTDAPALPATTLAEQCYYYMFHGCTGLTEAPELPATSLADHCYTYMFSYCSGLTSAPALPATQLTTACYSNMFEKCTGLIVAPTLPATSLAESCYFSMFDGCTGLIAAPALPATSMEVGCYSYMFKGCTEMTSAPVLPATTLVDNCYFYMFYGCSKLNYVKALCTDMTATNCTNNWLSGVAETGTFVKNSAATWDVSGVSGIPTGWTVVTADK